MAKELSLVLIKPDAVELSLTGEILSHLDMQEIILVGAKVIQPSKQMVQYHYWEHKDKPFFDDVVRYLLGEYHSFKFIYAFCYYGENACETIRKIAGKTNPMDRNEFKKYTTLRQKYGKNVIVTDKTNNEIIENGHVLVRYENVLHASFFDKSEYEVKLWFSPDEIVEEFRIYPVKQLIGENTPEKKTKIVWETDAEKLRKMIF